ncbi:MAG: RNA methyltransferase, partial [Luteibaculum sp.]
PFIADCVLLDAPCSGSGVFGRNPDRKYKLSPDELDELVNLQFDILRNYCKWVKPGGRLVYATCSIFKEENENQVHSFLKQHDEFKFVSEQLILPNKDHDGFYMAKLERKVD